MTKQGNSEICDEISSISRYVRFVAVIGKGGKLQAYKRRKGLKALLNSKNTKYQFSHIAITTDLEAFFVCGMHTVQHLEQLSQSLRKFFQKREG